MTTMVICPVFLSTSSPQESQGEAYSSSLSPKKKGKGGRKKNLHPPTPTIMKHRRNMANARERKRMNGLNDAFERLREVVPNVNTEQVCSNSFNNKHSFLNLIFCRRWARSRLCWWRRRTSRPWRSWWTPWRRRRKTRWFRGSVFATSVIFSSQINRYRCNTLGFTWCNCRISSQVFCSSCCAFPFDKCFSMCFALFCKTSPSVICTGQ